MYEVNAEKKPASLCFAPRSITCEGGCNGIAGRASLSASVEKNEGIKELTKRLSHIRMI
jgi:hypothetical protein